MALIKNLVIKNWLILLTTMLLFVQLNVNADTPKAETLFQKMILAYRTVDFEGRFTLILRMQRGNEVFEIKEIRKTPDKRRIEIVSPADLFGLGIVIDGDKNWRIEPMKDRHLPFHLLQPEQLEDTQFQNFRLLFKNYKIRIFNGGSVADRDTYLIDITPKMRNRPSRKVWVDTEKGIPLKVELYDSQKVLRRLIAYSNINFNPEINDSLFQNPRKLWDIRRRPPEPRSEEIWSYTQGKPDISKIRDKTQTDIKLFEQLPGGFTLQSINIVKFGKAKNVHLRYTDGLTVLSVFH